MSIKRTSSVDGSFNVWPNKVTNHAPLGDFNINRVYNPVGSGPWRVTQLSLNPKRVGKHDSQQAIRAPRIVSVDRTMVQKILDQLKDENVRARWVLDD